MSSGSDDPSRPRRTDPRYAAQFAVAVACREWAQVERLITLNASRGGVFLRTEKAPAVGTIVRLDLELPDRSKLPLNGTVVHVVTPEKVAQMGGAAGFGVRIDPGHAGDLLLLESMAQSFSAGAIEPLQPTPADAPGPPPPPSSAANTAPPVSTPRSAHGLAPTPPAKAAAKQTGEAHVTSIRIESAGRPIAIGRLQAGSKEADMEDLPCRSEIVVGIDYGTSYSTIAAIKNGEAYIVRDPQGRWLVPSVVSYPETGGVLVGWEARERIATDPSHTVQSAKRILGRKITESQVGNYVAQMAYRAVPGPQDQVVVDFLNGTVVSIPQMVAEVLRLLKRRAEASLGVAVEDAVMAVPVTFEAPQRNALRKAAQLAGLRVVGMIDEPAAAALAYGFGHGRNEVVAVYDFGGGTFDFTLIDISNEVFRIMASGGEPWLGGDDFDLAVATQAANEFWKVHKIELQKRVVEWQRLLFACEAAKRVLTDQPHAVVEVQGIVRTARGPLDLKNELSRERFEALCSELVQRSIDVVQGALEKVGLDGSHVGQVILTSGVTRIPMVRNAVSRFFDRELAQLVHPEEAVALGSAVQGAYLAQGSATGQHLALK